MSTIKFKLFLAGQFVGWMHVVEGRFWWKKAKGHLWRLRPIAFDEMRSFVCLDRWQKNEIYQGDTVTGPIISTGIEYRTGKVWYCDDEYMWMAGDSPLSDFSGVELVAEVPTEKV